MGYGVGSFVLFLYAGGIGSLYTLRAGWAKRVWGCCLLGGQCRGCFYRFPMEDALARGLLRMCHYDSVLGAWKKTNVGGVLCRKSRFLVRGPRFKGNTERGSCKENFCYARGVRLTER